MELTTFVREKGEKGGKSETGEKGRRQPPSPDGFGAPRRTEGSRQ
jgi:hypothetical protein